MQSMSMPAFSDCRLASLVPKRLLQSLHLHVVGDQERIGKPRAQPAKAGGRQGHRIVFVPLPDDGMADQHRIAEHLWRQRIEQLFLFGREAHPKYP